MALVDLAATLDPEDVNGRVIILPFMNYPAFRAGRRLSPIDGANMNRILSRPAGRRGHGEDRGLYPARAGAHGRSRARLPFGRRTLDFLPFAASHILADKAQGSRCREARDAFCAPYAMSMLEIDAVGMFDTAVEEAGKVFVTSRARRRRNLLGAHQCHRQARRAPCARARRYPQGRHRACADRPARHAVIGLLRVLRERGAGRVHGGPRRRCPRRRCRRVCSPPAALAPRRSSTDRSWMACSRPGTCPASSAWETARRYRDGGGDVRRSAGEASADWRGRATSHSLLSSRRPSRRSSASASWCCRW